ncbi:MAG: S-adenosylmethionine:tRNA ribosyltransferase-isomerase, partial [Deltaproteobacteria bacterium]|nr:S-adenosylmethionine:tRNA ribosyltransferase-isomerase [Deltaproteobacteria bacterium]
MPGLYRLDGFDYPLPQGLIAQFPCERRDESRLIILDRRTGDIKHKRFFEITDYLSPGEVLILNDTKVIPARLFGRKESGGRVEVLLLGGKRQDKDVPPIDRRGFLTPLHRDHYQIWSYLINPAKGIGVDSVITFDEGLIGRVVGKRSDSSWDVELCCYRPIRGVIDTIGVMPLPPYIKRETEKLDSSRYQT